MENWLLPSWLKHSKLWLLNMSISWEPCSWLPCPSNSCDMPILLLLLLLTLCSWLMLLHISMGGGCRKVAEVAEVAQVAEVAEVATVASWPRAP